MIRKILLVCSIIICSSAIHLQSEEGIWLPLLTGQLNLDNMQAKGLELSAEDIYSINNASLKDAVVIFGSGCTGEIISGNGLLLTNYHCALKYIQSHSTADKDYLTSGFWAYSREEELPANGLTATLPVAIEDVTDKILEDINDNLPYNKRLEIIGERIDSLIDLVNIEYPYKIKIKPVFYGNEYYMFTYKVFDDIRLVGAPPSSVGNFGGDTDNWIWPRHTGDFALFRIYADSANKPAEYSPYNIPYKPRKYLQISLNGYREGDFTMVYGFPATTQQFLTSSGINTVLNKTLPLKVMIRKEKENIIKTHINDNDELRIKYAAEYARIRNARKKWEGILEGLERKNVVQLKEEQESQFNNRINDDSTLEEKYGGLLPGFGELYNELLPYYKAEELLFETVLKNDLISFMSQFKNLVFYSEDASEETIKDAVEQLKKASDSFFKDYSIDIDKMMLARMLEIYYNNVDKQFHPDILNMIIKKSKGDFSEYSDYVFSKSIFVDHAKVRKLLQHYSLASAARIEDDPAFQLYTGFMDIYYAGVYPNLRVMNIKLDSMYRDYVEDLMEMQPDRQFYPDANRTLRLSFGKVAGYYPGDAVDYKYYSTLTGVMEKSLQDNYEYVIPERLKELYELKDYGKYGTDDTMHVCFIASNHTSGGNSGSPVLNGKGQLIGVNFDRNWEGTMSDYFYDPEICRNISVDIRYVLFIIDKYAKAGYLVDEMEFAE